MVRRPILLLLWGMENNNEKICSCALNKIFGFAPKTGLALISCIGSAKEVFEMGGDEIDKILGPYSRYRGLIGQQALDEAERELAGLEKMDVTFIGWNEDGYPELLHECEDAPVGLYVRTKTPLDELWKPRRRIAVIGTRDISTYGREWCMRTVSGLAGADEKPVIVSGLALGTDYYAHRTALEYGLPTIGVMATGPETVYPQRHHDFAERMYRTPGCALVTDYPPGTAPLSVHFLRRNRIIAGLSDATILIESKMKGGGMMTCNLAFSYNREVHALPGRADDLRSQGCNSLIRKKIAEPFTSVEELMAALDLKNSTKSRRKSTASRLEELYGNGKAGEDLRTIAEVMDLIKSERGITVDEIASSTGLPYSRVSTSVRMLETDGFITVDLLQRCSANIRA